MKKLITSIAVVLLLGSFTANAANIDDIKKPDATTRHLAIGAYQLGKTMKINMMVEKRLGEKATIKVLDNDRNVLYRETLGKKDGTFKFTFDMSELPAGTYYVETTCHGETVIKEVERGEKTLSY